MGKYTLVGVDGNAFAIMEYTARAMEREKFTKSEVSEMMRQAQESDYKNLLATCAKYVDAANNRAESRGKLDV